MEEQQYSKIIDSIPVFSGQSKEDIKEWLEIVSLKFDIIGYDARQKRRFIPQYLTRNALKWHLAHRDELSSWTKYTNPIIAAFPHAITTSRDLNLQLLKDRKQGDNEPFTEYYGSIIDLCRKHDSDMTDLQIIDWLKAGMKITLYDKLQGEDFATPQLLLHRARRIELNIAVLDARKRAPAILPSTFSSYSNVPKRYNQQKYYQNRFPSSSTPSYPPPLMSTPYSAMSYNNSNNTPASFYSYPSPQSYQDVNMSMSPRRTIGARDGRASIHAINPSLIIIPVTVHGSTVHSLLDTIATHTLITRSLLNTIPHSPVYKTPITTAVLGDANTTISVHGIVQLYIRINNIPTYTSAVVVDSLSVDLILGMDWCRKYNIEIRISEQELLLHHHRYGKITVQFQTNISIPVRLAQTIQLSPYHEHIVRLLTPVSTASQVSYSPDTKL
ncbi:unnamed protein product, partial [Rotaria sp. Silwood1]